MMAPAIAAAATNDHPAHADRFEVLCVTMTGARPGSLIDKSPVSWPAELLIVR